MGFEKPENLDRKLATIQDLLRQQNQGDRQLAEERFNQRRQEQAASEAARRQRELDKPNGNLNWRLHGSDKRKRLRRAAERDAEEARLAAEQALARGRTAEAEQERQEEIEAARQQEMLESREALSEPCPNCVHDLSARCAIVRRPDFTDVEQLQRSGPSRPLSIG